MLVEKPEKKIVLIGHVDHGKSTLIGRLLYDLGGLPAAVRHEVEALGGPESPEFAFVMDHLKEEREQGITIDSAQAYVETDEALFVLIDAPGHKEFLKNMITGATQANIALLMVDVREGVQEQTRRHAYLLSLVGVTSVVIAVNKMDTIGYSRDRFEAIRDELAGFFGQLELAPFCTIPISARYGDNVVRRSDRIPWYQGPCVLEAMHALRLTKPALARALRFPIQDVYTVRGKRILVGRVEAGSIRPGDPIRCCPSGETTKVRTIEVFGEDRAGAVQGESIGITVENPEGFHRGHVLAGMEPPPVMAQTLQARIFSLSRTEIPVGRPLSLKLATQEVPAALTRVARRIDPAALETIAEGGLAVCEAEVAEVAIRLEQPLVSDLYTEIPEMGRFVLVDATEPIAGGLVIGY